ncbi:MAG: hypothetical protein K2G91_07010, partial [Prevotella sp.]|nr:hypothetical protein [Prevotella sp.]
CQTMKKLALTFSFALLTFDASADETDWLNFATDPNGSVVESVLFRNHGRLTFGEAEMVYEADGERRSIPYSGGAYIFFSAKAATGIEDVKSESSLSLVYSKEAQQIIVRGADAVSQIRLVSLQGSVLRTSSNSQTISTAGLSPVVLIATAVCKDKTITKKFTIK